MLSASYLASCPDALVELYSNLENDIIADMARRLAKLGKVTDASVYQAKIYQEIGGLQSDIQSKLSKYDTKMQKRLSALFTEAMEKSATKDLAQLNKANLSDAQQQILDATVRKTAGTGIVAGSQKVESDAKNGYIKMFTGIQRATMTIADSMSGEFVQQANSAYMKVASGAFDYDTAIKQGVDDMAKKGVYTVEYTDSGKRLSRTVEGMLRCNIMTGINQTASTVTLGNAKDIGCNLVEVSAHLGARPSHAAWQGGIYSLNGEWTSPATGRTYKDFYEVCKVGETDGICGINCRHSYYPYFEGTEPEYSNGELSEMKDPEVTYNGKQITQYEAEQKQRAIERNVRKYKRTADAESAAGVDNTAARVKLGEWQKAARDLTEQTGLRRDYAREYIGTKSGKQPSGINSPTVTYSQTTSNDYKQAISKYGNVNSAIKKATYEELQAIKAYQKAASAPSLDYVKEFNNQTVDEAKLTQILANSTTAKERNALSVWTGSDYSSINDYLRNNVKTNFLLKNTAQNIHNAIEKCKSPAMYVRRGADRDYITRLTGSDKWLQNPQLLIKNRLTDKGFLATTPDIHGGFSREVMIYYKVPSKTKGVYIGGISHFANEKEMLYQDKSVIEIKEVRTEKLGGHIRFIIIGDMKQ